LSYGFRFFETHRLYASGEAITTARVWKGDPQVAALGLKDDLYVTIPRGQYDSLSAVMDLSIDLVAPLSKESPVGAVHVSLGEESISDVPLIVLNDVGEAGLLSRLIDEVKLWLR
jgi:D-alanyl-D-alanine carboxypeptidase (penicillin-binding protein 5/6)